MDGLLDYPTLKIIRPTIAPTEKSSLCQALCYVCPQTRTTRPRFFFSFNFLLKPDRINTTHCFHLPPTTAPGDVSGQDFRATRERPRALHATEEEPTAEADSAGCVR